MQKSAKLRVELGLDRVSDWGGPALWRLLIVATQPFFQQQFNTCVHSMEQSTRLLREYKLSRVMCRRPKFQLSRQESIHSSGESAIN